MKRSILIIICLCGIFLGGCDTEEEKERTKKAIAQASKNAICYIEEKYGFTPEILEADERRNREMFGSTPTTDIYVTMKQDDTTFVVYIDGANENTDGFDNYQKNEILSDMESCVEELTGIQCERILMKYGNVEADREEEQYNGLVKSLYKTGEFTEVLQEEIWQGKVETINETNFDVNAFYEKLVGEMAIGTMVFMDYPSKDAFAVPEHVRTGICHDIESANMIYEHGMYLQKVIGVSSCKEAKGIKTLDFSNMHNQAGIYVYTKKGTACNITVKPEDKINWKGEGWRSGKTVTKTYYVDGMPDSTYYFYIPVSEIDTEGEEGIVPGFCYDKDGEMQYKTTPLIERIGEYYVFNRYAHDGEDFYFTLIQ